MVTEPVRQVDMSSLSRTGEPGVERLGGCILGPQGYHGLPGWEASGVGVRGFIQVHEQHPAVVLGCWVLGGIHK